MESEETTLLLQRIDGLENLLNLVREVLNKYLKADEKQYGMSSNLTSNFVFKIQLKELMNKIDKQLGFDPSPESYITFNDDLNQQSPHKGDFRFSTILRDSGDRSEDNYELNQELQLLNNNQFQPKTNLIDFYILDFNIDRNHYQIFGIETDKIGSQYREAIRDLMFSTSKQHIRQKQKTPSMTQIHRLTSNPSSMKKPVILPSFHDQKTRYTYIFETQECLSTGLNYLSYDRYYCLVLRDLIDEAQMHLLMKQIRSKVFERRLTGIGQVEDVNCQKVKKVFKDNLNQYFALLPLQKPLKKAENLNYQSEHFYVTSELLTFNSFNHVNLLMILLYFMVKQEKIILLGVKQEKHILSEIILDLVESIKPLKYIYPIMLGTLTTNHCEFCASPMPMMIGLWGSEKRYKKIKQAFEKQLKLFYVDSQKSKSQSKSKVIEQQSLYRLVIDVHQMQVIGTNISLEDCYVLDKMEKYIISRQNQLKLNLIETIQKFIGQLMSTQNFPNQKEYQWIKIVQSHLKDTQMYSCFAQHKK